MKKRVVILHYAAPPIIGGVEVTIYHHARLLAQAGYEVEVAAGRGDHFHPRVKFHHVEELDSRHPAVLRIGEKLASGQVPDEFSALRKALVERLAPIISGAAVCIVHNAVTLHKNIPLTAALYELAGKGITRLIAWCHDFAWQDELYTPTLYPGYPWDLLRNPWPDATYVVVSAHRQKRLANLLKVPDEEILVVYPGVDIKDFLGLQSLTWNLVKRLNLLDSDPFLLLPARITRRKNLALAVRVTAALAAQKPKASLVVTGPPGPHNPKNQAYLSELTALCETLEIRENVVFIYQHGTSGKPLTLPEKVIADLYQLADVLFFPSRREGFGIPVLEAGLTRLPIFAAEIPPVVESTGGFAHLFDPDGDPRAIAKEILDELAKNREYLLKKKVIAQFTWESVLRDQVIPLIEGTKDNA